MRSLLITLTVLFFAITGHFIVINEVSRTREALRREEGTGFVIPSAVAKVVTLEFKGLLSDVLFSRAMTYYGGKLMRKENTSDHEWNWMYKNMDVATDLDPYFLDPYYFGAMTLAWEANKVQEANALLEKALRYRTWDWTIPFYLGFNHFYFLQDNVRASEYLMDASKKPGAITVLASLAAKLAYRERQTENAITFLQEILKKTDNEALKKQYETRLHAMNSTLYLERAVADYRNRFHKTPSSIDELTRQGILRTIPNDPYGGTFYLDSQGGVHTTSNFMQIYSHE